MILGLGSSGVDPTYLEVQSDSQTVYNVYELIVLVIVPP